MYTADYTTVGQPFVKSLKKKNVGNFCIFSPWAILTNFLTGIRHLTLHWRLQFHSNPLSVKNRLIWHFHRQLWLKFFISKCFNKIFFSKWCFRWSITLDLAGIYAKSDHTIRKCPWVLSTKQHWGHFILENAFLKTFESLILKTFIKDGKKIETSAWLLVEK